MQHNDNKFTQRIKYNKFFTLQESINIISRKSKMKDADHIVDSLKYLQLQYRITFAVLFGLLLAFGSTILWVL
jgi:hypothetical protein